MTNKYRRENNFTDQRYEEFLWGHSRPLSAQKKKLSKGVVGSIRANRKIQRDKTKFPEGMACVYVFEAKACCKVGFSTNLILRRRSLEHARGETLRIAFQVNLSEHDAKSLEHESHRYLKATGCHMRGEWYNLAAESVIAVIENSARQIGIDFGGSIDYDSFDHGVVRQIGAGRTSYRCA